MRIKLLLIVFLAIPFVAKGQLSTTFYNKGAMYIGNKSTTTDAGKNAVNSVMYVAGTSKLVTGSAIATTNESAISVTGDIVGVVVDNTSDLRGFSGAVSTGVGATQTIKGAPGYIHFVGTTETNIDIPTVGGVINRNYNLAAKQSIRLVDGAGNPVERSKHYLVLPSLYLPDTQGTTADPSKYLVITPTTSVAAPEIYAGVNSLFSIEAAYSATYARGLNVGQFIGTTRIAGSGGGFTNTTGIGYGMLDLKLYDPTKSAAGGLQVGSNYADATGNAFLLSGFTPMSDVLYPDYMMYNQLTRPKQGSFTGYVGPLTNPRSPIYPGYGYFIAMNVMYASDPQVGIIDDLQVTGYAERSVGTYHLGARGKFIPIGGGKYQSEFNKSPKDAANADAYTKENPFGTGKDVKVQLIKGMNFLANPFSAPLDLAPIVQSLEGNQASGMSGFGVAASDKATGDIQNKFWLVSNATITRSIDATDGKYYFGYKATFQEAVSTGGVHDLGTADADIYKVAPLQIFTLNVGVNGNDKLITLPFSRATFASMTTTKSSGTSRVDELLLQATILGSAGEDLSDDRACLVLRDAASMGVDILDQSKSISNIREGKDGAGKSNMTADGLQIAPYTGVLYTKASNGKMLSTNALPSTTKQVALYFTPPTDNLKEDKITVRIKPYRQDTWNTIQRAWLEDKYENKIVELTPETEYVFESKVMPATEAAENRFIVHFNEAPANIDQTDPVGENQFQIVCYYNESTLYIKGLNEGDINSKIQIFDMQGRLIGQTMVNEVPTTSYAKYLPTGTYVVKITGERNYTTKIVALQN